MCYLHKSSHNSSKTTDLDGPADDHDGVVQGALRLLRELLGSTSEDDGARLGLRAALEKVIPARRIDGFDQPTYPRPKLHRERQTLKKNWNSDLSPPTWTSSKSSHCPRTSSVMEPTEVWMEPPHACVSHPAKSFTLMPILRIQVDVCSILSSDHHGSLQILFLNSASTEQVSVGKVLGSHVTNWQLGQDHLGSRLVDLLQFVIKDVPLCVHNGLIVLQQEENTSELNDSKQDVVRVISCAECVVPPQTSRGPQRCPSQPSVPAPHSAAQSWDSHNV